LHACIRTHIAASPLRRADPPIASVRFCRPCCDQLIKDNCFKCPVCACQTPFEGDPVAAADGLPDNFMAAQVQAPEVRVLATSQAKPRRNYSPQEITSQLHHPPYLAFVWCRSSPASVRDGLRRGRARAFGRFSLPRVRHQHVRQVHAAAHQGSGSFCFFKFASYSCR